MPITSTFNAIRHMRQLMRYQNMAQVSGSQPVAKNVKQTQVEIANLKEYAKGSYNVGRVVSAIQSGKGRIQNNDLSVVEDGGVLPAGVDPSRQIKDIEPIMDYQVNAADQASINKFKQEQIRKQQMEAEAKKVQESKAELTAQNVAEADAQSVQMDQAIAEYRKQMNLQGEVSQVAEISPEPAPETMDANLETQNSEGATQEATAQDAKPQVQQVGNTIDMRA